MDEVGSQMMLDAETYFKKAAISTPQMQRAPSFRDPSQPPQIQRAPSIHNTYVHPHMQRAPSYQ
jgi:hypothetical protein